MLGSIKAIRGSDGFGLLRGADWVVDGESVAFMRILHNGAWMYCDWSERAPEEVEEALHDFIMEKMASEMYLAEGTHHE